MLSLNVCDAKREKEEDENKLFPCSSILNCLKTCFQISSGAIMSQKICV